MAEGNANRPSPETLTTEDVDRLSERFKPSWEVEPQQAAPQQAAPQQPAPAPVRPPLKQTMLGGTAPATPLAPQAPAPRPAAAPAPAAAAPQPAAKPMATVSVGKTGIETVKAVRHPTLVGIAPQAIRQVSGAPQAAPDDLDWELPAGEQPEPASDMAQTTRMAKPPEAAVKAETSRIQQVQPEPAKATAVAAAPAPVADEPIAIDVEELPPKSHPSGIGEKYVPRDQNAPAVVLDEEVQRTEAQARAKMEAQHRARSAPTVAKMPAVRVESSPLASPADFADEDTVTHRRKGKRGVWAVLAVLTLGGGAAAAAALLRKPEIPAPVVSTPAQKPVAAEVAAPPPPAVTAEPTPPPPAPSVAAEPAPSAPAAPEPPPAKVAAVAAPAEPAGEAPKRTPAPTARPTKPKPASTGKPAATRPSKSSVIVRDNPF